MIKNDVSLVKSFILSLLTYCFILQAYMPVATLITLHIHLCIIPRKWPLINYFLYFLSSRIFYYKFPFVTYFLLHLPATTLHILRIAPCIITGFFSIFFYNYLESVFQISFRSSSFCFVLYSPPCILYNNYIYTFH